MEISREFLLTFLNIGTFIQFLAAVFSSIYYRKYNRSKLKFFSFLLWYTFLNELFGIFFIDYISRYNAIIYNLYHVINFVLLFIIYKSFIKQKKYKFCVSLFIVIYLVTFLVNAFYENYLTEFQTVPHIVASALILICITFYFAELLKSIKVLHTNRNLMFWISIGLLIFFVGNIPFRIARNYYGDKTDISILFVINIILTIVMNVCFIIGFIWSKKKQLY